jgi:hypothetical protein
MFRVSHRGEGIDDADAIEGSLGIVRGRSRAVTKSMRSGPNRSPRAYGLGNGAG